LHPTRSNDSKQRLDSTPTSTKTSSCTHTRAETEIAFPTITVFLFYSGSSTPPVATSAFPSFSLLHTSSSSSWRAAAAAAAAPALKYTARCTSAAAAIPKMAGVTVRGEFFAFDCEAIHLNGENLGEALLPLLERFSRGEFTRVEALYLVIAALLR
jgi:hypothetical protein